MLRTLLTFILFSCVASIYAVPTYDPITGNIIFDNYGAPHDSASAQVNLMTENAIRGTQERIINSDRADHMHRRPHVAAQAPFSKAFEHKVKYERFEGKNNTKLEFLARVRFQNENSWADGKVKISLRNADTYYGKAEIDIERLLVGYSIYNDDNTRAFVQIGHTKLDSLFQSEMQFNSRLNGIHGYYVLGNFSVQGVATIADIIGNNYGFIGEASYKDILGYPVAITYSLADWMSIGDYLISQATVSYHIGDLLDQPITAYVAAIMNHKASKEALSGYAGVSFGKLEKAHDWLVDAMYQYTGDRSIPLMDYQGILTGAKLKATYNITDQLSLQAKGSFPDVKCLELCAAYKW